jgi:hypothetical protein
MCVGKEEPTAEKDLILNQRKPERSHQEDVIARTHPQEDVILNRRQPARTTPTKTSS